MLNIEEFPFAQLGGLDVLINNAGIGIPQSATDRPGDDALAVFDVNLLAWRSSASTSRCPPLTRE